jgi:pSer/pThr/pTyr-binding forkhead associated (FHA) protein
MLDPRAEAFWLSATVGAFLLCLPRVRIGSEEAEPDSYDVRLIEVEVEHGGRRRTERLPRSALIGRGHTAALVLNDPQVSRLHARLELRDGVVHLEDLGSLNGTGRNGQKLNGTTRLEPGDRLQIGSATITFRGVGTWK